MKNAILIASVASMIEQFNMNNIEILQNLGYKVDVACNFKNGSTISNDRLKEFIRELKSKNIRVFHLPIPRNLNITKIKKSYDLLKKLIEVEKYDIVHCHSPIGGVITRLACRNARKNGTKVIYTAHGFHFFKGAPLINWLIYYPVERFCARYTDCLITINKEDYKRAKKFKAKEVIYVPGVGIDTDIFFKTNIDKYKKCKELGIDYNKKILLSVGELSKRKNHQIVIKALAKIKNENIVYVICGQGNLEKELKQLTKKLSIENQVKFLGYRTDTSEIYKIADIFVFPSLQEGLPVALMEAMASGLPVIASKIRGNVDLIKNNRNGYLVKFNDVNGFSQKIQRLINMDNKNIIKIQKINQEKIKNFSIKNINKKMQKIYLKYSNR